MGCGCGGSTQRPTPPPVAGSAPPPVNLGDPGYTWDGPGGRVSNGPPRPDPAAKP